jgi:hypothetical protein
MLKSVDANSLNDIFWCTRQAIELAALINKDDERRKVMFGIPDAGVWSAYLLCILSALACVVYGLINWNRGDDIQPEKPVETKPEN